MHMAILSLFWPPPAKSQAQSSSVVIPCSSFLAAPDNDSIPGSTQFSNDKHSSDGEKLPGKFRKEDIDAISFSLALKMRNDLIVFLVEQRSPAS
jgi:hypothetical protein